MREITYKVKWKVNDLGEVYNIKKNKVLKPDKYTKYNRVQLGQGAKKESVHRLVATLFIPNPKNKPCVNHINGDKRDNRYSNLEWVTHSENEIHSRDVLGKVYLKGMNLPQTKICEEQSILIKMLYSTGDYTKTDLGNIFEIGRKAIYRHL
tara:strand:+ start:690 stop:1142 length:453 start_codon:yes stop_codon:yes gene_type:complete